MSYLSTALNRTLDRYQWKQADVARETGLTRSYISRVFNGDQRTVADEDFVVLLRPFRRDPRDQAELVAARCMDARVGRGPSLSKSRSRGRRRLWPERVPSCRMFR